MNDLSAYRKLSRRLSVNSHPPASLVQTFLLAVVGTGIVVGATVGLAVVEIATRKWPAPVGGVR